MPQVQWSIGCRAGRHGRRCCELGAGQCSVCGKEGPTRDDERIAACVYRSTVRRQSGPLSTTPRRGRRQRTRRLRPARSTSTRSGLPWSTAPATGPVGRLGRPSASDPWGVGSFLSLGRPTCVQCPGPLGSCSPVCPRGLLCCVCGVPGHLAPVHRCARSVCCVACAVSWATWLPFTGVRAVCGARVPWVVVSLFLPP